MFPGLVRLPAHLLCLQSHLQVSLSVNSPWEWTHAPKKWKQLPHLPLCTRPIMPCMAAIPGDEVATIPHTAGIRDAGTFRRRIMKLIQKPIEVGGPQRVALMLAYAAFGLASRLSAAKAVKRGCHLRPD
jgi:hypothetical protein